MRKALLCVLLLGIAGMALPGIAQAQCPPGSWVLSGSVIGPQGGAIAAADIDIFAASTGTKLALSGDFTNASGEFALTICQAIPVGLYDIVINPPVGTSYFGGGINGQFLSGSTSVGIFNLELGAMLSGIVVNDLGIGLEEVDLNFFDPVTGVETLFSGDVTDALGNFSVLVTPGFYDVEFRATPGTIGGPYVPVSLSDRPLFSDLDVGTVLFHDAHNLSGVVSDPGGIPVVGADIDVRDPVTGEKIYTPGDNTDGSGSFLVGVPEGPWEIEIDPPLGSSLVAQLIPVVVVPGGTTVGNIVLPIGVSVTGTAVDQGGTPVADVDLDFVISATGVEIPTVHDNANSSGEFSVQVETDTYDIEFRPPYLTGLAPRVLPSVVVAANTNLGQVPLDPGISLSGTVTAVSAPVEGVVVTLSDSSSGAPVYLFGNDTDALGMYAIRQLPGTYDVTFTPPAGSGLSAHVEFSQSLFLDLVLDVDLGAGGSPPPPIGFLSCAVVGNDVGLEWTNGAPDYDSIQIFRDGVLRATLPGSFVDFSDPNLGDGTYVYLVIAIRAGLTALPAECTVVVSNLIPPQPVANLGCEATGSDIDLLWVNGDADYDSIEIFRDGVPLATLPGSSTGLSDLALADGTYLYSVIATRAGLASTAVQCTVTIDTGPQATQFIRADANGDGGVNLADAIYILAYLFSTGTGQTCLDALDPNDSGAIDVADAVYLLAFLFSAGDAPPLPYPEAGTDPTPDGLPCP